MYAKTENWTAYVMTNTRFATLLAAPVKKIRKTGQVIWLAVETVFTRKFVS